MGYLSRCKDKVIKLIDKENEEKTHLREKNAASPQPLSRERGEVWES